MTKGDIDGLLNLIGYRFEPECDGLCLTAADIGVGSAAMVAYPHPGCPLHAPEQVCDCGQPDRCLSPTHGEVAMPEALEIRHRQAPRCQGCDQPLGEGDAGGLVHRLTGSADCNKDAP